MYHWNYLKGKFCIKENVVKIRHECDANIKIE